jgi:hypothetical protein
MDGLQKYYEEETEEWIVALNYLGVPFFAYFDSEKERDWIYDYLINHPGFSIAEGYKA